jgi:hypothetical protein
MAIAGGAAGWLLLPLVRGAKATPNYHIVAGGNGQLDLTIPGPADIYPALIFKQI